MPNRVALFILDGLGESKRKEGNAVYDANTPFLDSLREKYPFTIIDASGEAVGLPEGQMGNSEVGHLNLGAGRVVYQSLTKVSKSIRDGDFFENKVFVDLIENCKKNKTALHLIGLISDGGVHSHLEHLYALISLAKDSGVEKVFIHGNLDGRDVPPRSALKYIEQVEEKLKEIGVGEFATISGRYYGMDRDNRWERVEKAYNAIVLGEGESVSSAKEAVERSYNVADNNDEFCLPSVITKNNSPVGVINDSDSVLFFNFRPDRAREMSRAIGIYDFDGFERKRIVKVHYATLTQYDKTFPFPVAYPPESLKDILAEVLAENKMSQLRIAETEKYAHVTFFFNGQVEDPYPMEERILVPSPKVATYDLQPEMSAYEVAEKLEEAIKAEKFDTIICNFANCDMVGHTGFYEAAVKAVEAVDECLSKVVPLILERGGEVLITADHGNADEMLMEDGSVSTQHSTNPVPFIAVSNKKKYSLREGGRLCDVAPTLLKLLEIKKPEAMTGESIITD